MELISLPVFFFLFLFFSPDFFALCSSRSTRTKETSIENRCIKHNATLGGTLLSIDAAVRLAKPSEWNRTEVNNDLETFVRPSCCSRETGCCVRGGVFWAPTRLRNEERSRRITPDRFFFMLLLLLMFVSGWTCAEECERASSRGVDIMGRLQLSCCTLSGKEIPVIKDGARGGRGGSGDGAYFSWFSPHQFLFENW